MAKKRNTDNIWQTSGNEYIPGKTTSQKETLPPGVFKYNFHPQRGWWLTLESKGFEFPYKIYGNHDHIVDRVKKAWKTMSGNLGLLLNGLKGTGKTVTAQLLANWVISELKMPVLVVTEPIPLATVLAQTEQEMLVIFDEFEKTHVKKEDQQALLTALDGMARNKYKRMFIFTTNNTYVEENLIDRPSRIRYMWEFDRLQEDVIEELMDDMLDTELSQYRADIVSYLTSRNVCSIDSAKTTINEVNVFGEAPSDFEDALNLSETKTSGFVVEVLDEEDAVIDTFSSFFTPPNTSSLRTWLSKAGARRFKAEMLPLGQALEYRDNATSKAINLLQPDEEDSNIWFAHLAIPKRETWIRSFKGAEHHMHHRYLWMDERPSDFAVPEWVVRAAKGLSLYEDEEKGLSDLSEEPYNWPGTVYGTTDKMVFRLRITPKKYQRSSGGYMGAGPVVYRTYDASSEEPLDA